MIKFAIDKWYKNKNKLEAHIEDNLKDYEDCEYKKLVEDVVQYIYSDEPNSYNDFSEFDVKEIAEIDNGHYQGNLLYLIPQDTYQPDETEYLMTHVSYGSCSGCDTLQDIQSNIYYITSDDDWVSYTKEELEKMKQQAISDLAWDKVYEHFHEGDLIREYILGDFNDDPEYIVTQYTGLKDKNGIEIYEDDIVNVNNYGGIPRYEKVKSYTNAGFAGVHPFTDSGHHWSSNKCEIVGNR